MADFLMPSLGADTDAGTLLEWKVKPGQSVSRGQIIAVVETDKGAVDVEIWEDGTIESLLITPPAKVPVGTALARLRTATATTPAAGPGQPGSRPACEAIAGPTAPRVSAVPSARARARELGIDLTTLTGSGPHGAITRADVDRAAAGKATAPASAPVPAAPAAAPAAARDPGAMRRAIAAAMSRSKREIPHYYLSCRIDMTRALAWLEGRNAEAPVAERILPAALLLRAVAGAAREVPEVNGFWIDGAAKISPHVHAGVVLSLRGGGLVAPAIHDADTLPLPDLMKALADLITRARAGSLRSSEMSDPTITITNLGDLGVEQVFGVIFPPQLALVGFGKIIEAPVVSNGVVVARPTLVATLAADHRATDGHTGGRFLTAITRILEHPEES